MSYLLHGAFVEVCEDTNDASFVDDNEFSLKPRK